MTGPLRDAIAGLVEGRRLSRQEAASAMGVIMDGHATDAQIGAFLAAIRVRGDHVPELLGFLDAFRARAVTVRVHDPAAVDLCGTGGDGKGTINISTIAAFVVAGAGVTVAKHGNRAVSSRSGSADVLRELGVGIDVPPSAMEACINETGVGFLFAPIYHPAMKFAAKPRSELGIRTCFNILGPLANPAGVRRQVVGTFSREAASTLAAVLREARPDAALVVTSRDGLDEVSPAAPTEVVEIRGSAPERRYDITPETFGLALARSLEGIAGGTPEANAGVVRAVLGGATGPARDAVLMNAALGVLAARDGMSHADAFARCVESLDSGRALGKLRALVERTIR